MVFLLAKLSAYVSFLFISINVIPKLFTKYDFPL